MSYVWTRQGELAAAASGAQHAAMQAHPHHRLMRRPSGDPRPRTTSPARPARRRDDALHRWASLRNALRAHFRAYTRAPASHRALPRRRLLLALEQLWKLEEHALLPALIDADAGTRADADALERELTRMREMVDRLRDDTRDPVQAVVLMAALEGVTTLRALRLERALALAIKTRRLDGPRLAQDMEEWLARWQAEMAATGDIEDEEADPVGRPPR
jgi:hypothetical protein